MKNILQLNEKEARKYLLKKENYSALSLPIYFDFQGLLHKISKEITGKNLSDYTSSSPRDFDDINYFLIANKDGKYAWRPFQLIHPAIYVSLVHKITEPENWKKIIERFAIFQQDPKIKCHSLPVVSESKISTDKSAQILTWWQKIEQKSLTLALDYKYVLHTDITDCYGSIYTHSISWAIHTKAEAKKKNNRRKKSLIGVAIDNHLQDMSFGQTNGIPQGSVLMDFISEIVLGYVDLLLSEKLEKIGITKFQILRYRDDYRIFSNNSLEVELIGKELSEILSMLGLKINADKTIASDDIIKSSIKPDKRYWISNKRIASNKQKWLIQLYLLSEVFPNSGTVDIQMREFLKVLQKSKKKDSNLHTLISLVTEISLRNPRVVPTAIAILSIFLNRIKDKDEKLFLVNKIKAKYDQVPNSSFLMVWFQRLYLKINKEENYNLPLCEVVFSKEKSVWNQEWLNDKLKKIFRDTPIVNYEEVKKTRGKISNKEIKKIVTKKKYYD